jgi:hypothetical protein
MACKPLPLVMAIWRILACNSVVSWHQTYNRGLRMLLPGVESRQLFVGCRSRWSYGDYSPPSSSASVLPGRRLQVKSNLLASMPIRRPLSFGVVGSRHLTPSGHVPGGVVLDCIVACTSSGVGAGPDCISCVFFRVPSAKSLDLCVLFFYLPVLLVIMPLFNGSS